MTLPAGQISLGQVNTELGLSATTLISLNQANVRALAGVPSGQIAMSNLQGKANASNFIASLFDTSDYQMSESASYGVAYSGSTMFTVGVIRLFNAGTDRLLICSYTSTGTLNWKKQITNINSQYSTATRPSCVCDSSGNLYVVYARVSTGANIVIKLNSSGVIQWQKNLGDLTTPYALAIDSSDGLYLAGKYGSDRGIVKFDTSGSATWGRGLNISNQGTQENDNPQALAVGGGYVYVYSNGNVSSGSAGHILYKLDTSGTLSETVSMTNGQGIWSANITSGGQLVAVGAYNTSSNAAYIFQSDPTALTSGPTWQTGLATPTFPYGVTSDSSNNVYVAIRSGTGQNNRTFTFAKYNSSGTLQFQRLWKEYNVNGQATSAYAITMASSGKVAVVGNQNIDSLAAWGPFNTVVATDGTTTGNYSNAGATFTYGAGTMTATTPSYSYTSRTGTATSFTPNNTTTSATIADATNITSYVTIL
jgi:hypothetical protein